MALEGDRKLEREDTDGTRVFLWKVYELRPPRATARLAPITPSEAKTLSFEQDGHLVRRHVADVVAESRDGTIIEAVRYERD